MTTKVYWASSVSAHGFSVPMRMGASLTSAMNQCVCPAAAPRCARVCARRVHANTTVIIARWCLLYLPGPSVTVPKPELTRFAREGDSPSQLISACTLIPAHWPLHCILMPLNISSDNDILILLVMIYLISQMKSHT